MFKHLTLLCFLVGLSTCRATPTASKPTGSTAEASTENQGTESETTFEASASPSEVLDAAQKAASGKFDVRKNPSDQSQLMLYPLPLNQFPGEVVGVYVLPLGPKVKVRIVSRRNGPPLGLGPTWEVNLAAEIQLELKKR